MRRFFWASEVLNFFSGIQTFKRPRQRFVQAKQSSPSTRGAAFPDLFSRRGWAISDPKICREIPGGGGVAHDRFFERAK
jgi:hypothetical protein